MKRLLLLLIAAVMLCPTAFGWARRQHAAVAKIAENHLTPKAKKLLTEYLDGRSIVFYASHLDDYKSVMLIDVGFNPTNGKRVTTLPHSFFAEANYKPYSGIERNGEFVKNCLYYTQKASDELRANHRTMDDSTRIANIALIVHCMGDMHCPQHVRYPDSMTLGYYKVTWNNKTIRYHDIWDDIFVSGCYPWGYGDIAELLDTASKSDIAEITKGDIYAWGEDVARRVRPTHEYKEGTQISPLEYRRKFKSLAEDMISRAGYRLAKILNDTFK